MRLWCRAALACLIVALAAACTSPPNKEMDQAQGAIDAARAAGADRYAQAEFAAATTALKNATDAVDQGDYRLALNHAIDSREQAQNAARVAADTRARVRGEVERSIAEVSALITQVNAWIASPAAARTPRTRRTAQQVVTQSTADVQKAGSAMQAEDYAGAQKLMTATKERLQKALPAAPTAATAQSTRRRK
jgi:HAMP domain-containing protein